MLPYEELPFLELPEIIERRVQEMLGILNRAEKSIEIFSGEGHCIIFSHPDVRGILRKKHAEGISIEIILGPVLSVWPDGPRLEQKGSGILEMADEGVVGLFRREKRGSHFHFIIVDGKAVWTEKPHPPLEALFNRQYEKKDPASPDFIKALRTFRRFRQKKYRVRDPREDFLLLFPSQINQVCESSEINGLTRDEIENILKK